MDGVLNGEAVARPLDDVTKPPERRDAYDLTLVFGHQDNLVISEPLQNVIRGPFRNGPLNRRRGEERIQEGRDLDRVCIGGTPHEHPFIRLYGAIDRDLRTRSGQSESPNQSLMDPSNSGSVIPIVQT